MRSDALLGRRMAMGDLPPRLLLLAPLAIGLVVAPLITLLRAEPATAVAEKETPAKEKEASGEHWVRLVKDKSGEPVSMEVAIGRFVPAEDYVAGKPAAEYKHYVDLVGAVHIGDLKYYQELNRRFEKYDAVLYELVAPAGTVVPKGRGTSNEHPLGALQNGLKTMLEVEHQLEQVDYTRPNFVHADLSPDEFFESMADREETFTQMYFRMIGTSLAQQSQQSVDGESSEMDLLGALFSDDRPRQLKIAMAKQFEGMEQLLVGFSGPDGSTLITERNKRALDVLEKELAAGKEKLAIFYGAGHLKDMQKQLVERFKMKPVGMEWVEAWDLRKK